MSEIRNRFEIFLWLASLLCTLLLLQLLGESTYSLPSLNGEAFRDWLATTETAVVVFTAIRITAMVAIAYLLIATLVCAIAHRSPSLRFIRVVDALTIPTARAFAVRLASISAVSALALPATTAHAAGPTDAPTMRHLLPDEPLPSFTPATKSTVPTASNTAPTTTSTTAAPKATTVEPLGATGAARRHVVQRGENFWVIAQDKLTNQLHREPTDAEVTSYWRQLVELNSHRLKQQDNPDLIFAGQQIDLPEVSVKESRQIH